MKAIRINNSQIQMINNAKKVEGRVQTIALMAALAQDQDTVDYILDHCANFLSVEVIEVLLMPE